MRGSDRRQSCMRYLTSFVAKVFRFYSGLFIVARASLTVDNMGAHYANTGSVWPIRKV